MRQQPCVLTQELLFQLFTGSSFPMKELTGRQVAIKPLDAEPRWYPTAFIEVEVDNWRAFREVAVSNTIAYDAILGLDIPVIRALVYRPSAPAEVFQVQTRATSKREANTLQEDGEAEEWREAEIPNQIIAAATVSHESDETLLPTTESDSDENDPTQLELDEYWLHQEGTDRSVLTPEERLERKQEELSRKKQPDRDQLVSEQQQDPALEEVRIRLRTSDPEFVQEDGLIFKTKCQPEFDTESRQLVLPSSFQEQAPRTAHQGPMAAHLGQKKTLQRLRQCVYWPGMFVDVQKMCRACPDCQRSVRVLKPKAPLVPVPIIDIPFERIAMDIIGPLPRTKAGNCYILTLMDYRSRYPEAIPIRQTDSKTIAQALIGLFSRVGIPREILTDCGANLTGKLMSDIC